MYEKKQWFLLSEDDIRIKEQLKMLQQIDVKSYNEYVLVNNYMINVATLMKKINDSINHLFVWSTTDYILKHTYTEDFEELESFVSELNKLISSLPNFCRRIHQVFQNIEKIENENNKNRDKYFLLKAHISDKLLKINDKSKYTDFNRSIRRLKMIKNEDKHKKRHKFLYKPHPESYIQILIDQIENARNIFLNCKQTIPNKPIINTTQPIVSTLTSNKLNHIATSLTAEQKDINEYKKFMKYLYAMKLQIKNWMYNPLLKNTNYKISIEKKLKQYNNNLCTIKPLLQNSKYKDYVYKAMEDLSTYIKKYNNNELQDLLKNSCSSNNGGKALRKKQVSKKPASKKTAIKRPKTKKNVTKKM